jgi:hypothetical protein
LELAGRRPSHAPSVAVSRHEVAIVTDVKQARPPASSASGSVIAADHQPALGEEGFEHIHLFAAPLEWPMPPAFAPDTLA